MLLVVNLLLLSFALTRKGSAVTASPPPTPVPAAHETSPAPDARHFSPLDSAPVYAPEIPVPAADHPAPEPPAASHTPSAAAETTAARTPHHADPVLTDEDSKADNLEVLPSISEISLSGAQALPELHLDVHVYATKPAERFVYINMRKYHEGSVLQDGPTVERIRRDGVVLNYQGLRFILPRQP